MKVGVTLWFQNLPDLFARANRPHRSSGPVVADHEKFREELRVGDLVEELGFDALWTIEHHFGPYSMTTNPLHLLSYFAGRTRRIELGTMVVVLPWHDPLRVAEGISLLDQFIDGRRLMIGVGRGGAPEEFKPFGVDYAAARSRMEESLEVVRRALVNESFSFEGEHFSYEDVSIRPRPRSTDLTRNMLAGWSSEETMRWAANQGLAPLFAQFSTWQTVVDQTATFNKVRRSHGWEPVSPIAATPVFCATTDDEAAEARRQWLKTWDSSVLHYGLLGQPRIRKMLEGKVGEERERVLEEINEKAATTGIFGTPEGCIEQISEIHEQVGLAQLICQMHFGDLRLEDTERSMRLFAEKVLPAVHALPSTEVFSTAYNDVRTVSSAWTEAVH